MQEKFEEALKRNWEDLEAHRALAEWLIKQGDPRGTLARCQLELEDDTLTPERRQMLRDQEQALLAQHREAWLGDFIPKKLKRGQPVIIDDPKLQPQIRWQRGWVVGLHFDGLSVDLARQIAPSVQLRFLRELQIEFPSYYGRVGKKDRLSDFPYKKFRKTYGLNMYSLFPLALSPHLGNVRKLIIGKQLSYMDLTEGGCNQASSGNPDGLVALLSRMPHLEHLCVNERVHNADLVELFSLAGPKPALREVELYYLMASDVSKMLCCPSLDGVRRLTLHSIVRWYDRVFSNLEQGLAAPHMPSIERLHIYREGRGDELLAELAASPVFGRLRELVIVCSNLTDAGAQTLLDARQRSALTALDVSFSVFSRARLEQLRQAYPFLVAKNIKTPEEEKQYVRDNLILKPAREKPIPAVPAKASVTDAQEIGRIAEPGQPAAMRRLTVTGLAAGANRIRRLQSHGTTLAVLVGDDSHTHTVVWLRLPDGAELHRRDVTAAEWAADPVLSPDLDTLVYAELNGNWPQFVVEKADGGRQTIPYPDWRQEGILFPGRCMSLGHSGILRASLDDGALFGWDLRHPDLPLVEGFVESNVPAVAMEHGPIPSVGKEGLVIAGMFNWVYFGYPVIYDVCIEITATPVAAAFAANGAQFAIAFPDHRVQVWNAADPYKPKEHATLRVPSPRSLAFSPDSATLATAQADGHILFWSGDMAAPRADKEWGIGALGGVAFASDGKTCVVGGEEGRLALWDVG